METPEFVERLCAGCHEAFTEMVREHTPRLRMVVVRYFRSDQHADEIVQTVFIRAFLNITKFRGESTLSTWLHTITFNSIQMHVRAARNGKNSLMLPDTGASEIIAAPVGGRPDAQLESAQLGAALGRAIDGLDEKSRMVLVLSDVEGLTYEEIAQKVGRPTSYVRTRLCRARTAIRGDRSVLELRERNRICPRPKASNLAGG